MKVKEHLIREAQLLTSGAEIHDTNGMIGIYRSAAENDHPSAHVRFLEVEQLLEEHIVMLRGLRYRNAMAASR